MQFVGLTFEGANPYRLKSILRIWSMRDMTPIGRITIVKSLGLSQLIYLFSVLPKPDDDFLKDLETVLYKAVKH